MMIINVMLHDASRAEQADALLSDDTGQCLTDGDPCVKGTPSRHIPDGCYFRVSCRMLHGHPDDTFKECSCCWVLVCNVRASTAGDCGTPVRLPTDAAWWHLRGRCAVIPVVIDVRRRPAVEAAVFVRGQEAAKGGLVHLRQLRAPRRPA